MSVEVHTAIKCKHTVLATEAGGINPKATCQMCGAVRYRGKWYLPIEDVREEIESLHDEMLEARYGDEL